MSIPIKNQPDPDSHLVFEVIRYGLNKKYFTFREMADELNLIDNDREFVWGSLISQGSRTTSNPNHLIAFVNQQPGGSNSAVDHIFTLLPNAITQYVDYLEIKNARIAATSARRLAWVAILISLGIGLAQIILMTG